MLILLLLFQFIALSTESYATSNELDSSRELHLSEFQYKKMSQDFPISSMAIDQGKTIWLSGRRSIWRWQLKTNSLKKINILDNKNGDRLVDIAIVGQSIYVSSKHELFQIDFEPLKISRIKNPHTELKFVGLSTSDSELFWITTSGVFALNPKTKTITQLRRTPKLRRKDKVIFDPNFGNIWLLRGRKVLIYNLIDNTKRPKILLKARHKLVSIDQIGTEIYIHTKHTILRYNIDGSLTQTIPVEGKRKLVTMSNNKDQHAYLFSDKLLEVYSMKNAKSRKFVLPFGRVKRAQKMVTNESMIGLVLDGKPSVFQLSGQW